jgi:general secretion pathway protein D
MLYFASRLLNRKHKDESLKPVMQQRTQRADQKVVLIKALAGRTTCGRQWIWLALAAAMLLPLFTPARALAQSEGTWLKRGAAAEAREDYDTAYEDYKKAFQKSPSDLRTKTNYERLRFLAATTHVDKGRALRKAGDDNGALTEYMRALEIDPSNQTAEQEINSIRQSMLTPATSQTTQQDEELRELNAAPGPVELKPISDDPVTLHMVEDTKVIYQAIGKAAGLNVLFDPDYTSKRIPYDVQNMNLYDALRILGTVSGTFWKPVTSNTIFIAQNTRQKRTDLDDLAVQTFYLSNVEQQSDANDVLTAVRNVLDPQSAKTFLVPGQNALIIRATPDQLLLAQKIINDMDRARPEVVVDVSVLEVNRDKLRNIGLTLPQSFGLTLQPPNTSTTTTSTTSTSGTTTTPTTGSGLTLSNLGGLNSNNFAVSVGTATANLLLTDSDTRVLQNPSIRATDGQKATLKIGSRIPIATGSYSSGVATTAVSSLVSTQFTYIDVGVNIDMTPTVHYDHDVTLKLSVEVSTETGSVTISGITEPIIGQNTDTTEIRLKEGESTILASILTKSMAKSVTGIPFLGEIPILKYLFGSTSVENDNDEVVFLLTPHIVREQQLTPENTRAIDTGTSNEIELLHSPDANSDQPTVQPAVLQGPRGNTQNTAVNNPSTAGAAPQATFVMQPSPQPQPAPQQQGPPVAFSFTPAEGKYAVGSTFQVTLQETGGRDLSSVPLQVQFDPTKLQLVDVNSGDLLGRDGQAVALVHRDDGNGGVTMNLTRPPNTTGITGDGNVCVFTFKAIAQGDVPLTLARVGAKNSSQVSLPAVSSPATLHLQ